MTTLDNKPKANDRRKFWDFRAQSDSGVAELYLYGNIGPDDGWGWLFDEISPKMFKEELDALGLGAGDTLKVFINSDGGDVFAGQAIHSMLSRHPATVEVYIDGLAASIASVIAMAGDRVIMPANAMMMIHAPWTIAAGNAEEFREIADTLDKVQESIVAAYQKKTDMDTDQLNELLAAETWMTAAEAVEMGFADGIEEAKQIAASLRGGVLALNGQKFDMSRFKCPPKLAFLPPSPTEEPPDDPQENEPDDGREEELLALERELLRAALF